MSTIRLLVLILGPFVIVAASYCLAYPNGRQNDQATRKRSSGSVVRPQATSNVPAGANLEQACQNAAQKLRQDLPGDFECLVRVPYVLAGDLARKRLLAIHSDVIAPVTRALTATYLSEPRLHPILIVICSTELRFRELAERWDGRLEAGYHGYYQRDQHRILLDLEAGNGCLAHELTHALTHCDCENLPEWFDEGLGALHEEAEFRPQGPGLRGLSNWRCQITREALQTKQLPSLRQIADPNRFRDGNVAINYATARSFCLFLQDRDSLIDFYRNLRSRSDRDTTGLESLCKTMRVSEVSLIDRDFRSWLKLQAKQRTE